VAAPTTNTAAHEAFLLAKFDQKAKFKNNFFKKKKRKK
jgi:hypothetical protein